MDTQVTHPLFVFFADQLVRAREAKGWSRETLGSRLGFSASQVAKVETRLRRPTLDFAQACDRVFPELLGGFTDMVQKAEKAHTVTPEWFTRWLDVESRASVIRWWEPALVPGLLQTPDYARAAHEAWLPIDSGQDIGERVAARIERQRVLDSETPPSLQVLLDEAALRRRVGTPATMHEQLGHLITVSERPRVSIQVVPADVGVHVGCIGGFIIASFPDGTPGMVYMDTPNEGEITKHPVTVERVSLMFDELRTHALSASASAQLIKKVDAEQWT